METNINHNLIGLLSTRFNLNIPPISSESASNVEGFNNSDGNNNNSPGSRAGLEIEIM
jgi:hypothetical protein